MVLWMQAGEACDRSRQMYVDDMIFQLDRKV
jgi:hypothetical protein